MTFVIERLRWPNQKCPQVFENENRTYLKQHKRTNQTVAEAKYLSINVDEFAGGKVN